MWALTLHNVMYAFFIYIHVHVFDFNNTSMKTMHTVDFRFYVKQTSGDNSHRFTVIVLALILLHII